MKKVLLIITLIFFTSQNYYPQFLYSSNADSLMFKFEIVEPTTELVNKFNPQKPLWIPIVEAFTQNLLMGSFNYLSGSDFAKLSFSTVQDNFERGWSTDTDAFPTNMVGHPFQGTVYYNLARSSGYNFWGSLGMATIGSWHWEYFMENEPPAWNDQVMTAYGGSLIGEVFYRLSSLIIDETAVGAERFWRELGAGVFNPGRLFNRLISGRTSRITHEKLYRKENFLGEVAMGANNVAEGTDLSTGDENPMFTLDFAYGRLFKNTKIKPFDFFRLKAAVNLGNQPLIGQLSLYNIFAGKVINYRNKSSFFYGLFGYFDYLENNVYQVGGTGVGLGIGYKTKHEKSFQFIGTLNAGTILMGGANSDYAIDNDVEFFDSSRTYNMGPGALVKAETFFRFSFGSLYIGYDFWWIHTWDGAPGDEFIGMLAPKFRIRVYRNWFVGLEYLLYHRYGKYDNLEDRNYRNNEQRLFIGYAF